MTSINKSKILMILRGVVFISFIAIPFASIIFQKNCFIILRPTSYILLFFAIVSAIKSNRRGALK